MIRKILLCICMGGMLAACSEDILPEVPMFSGSEDHVPMADFIFDGTEGYRELQVDVRDVVAGETEGGFLTFVPKEGKSYLYLEQNDEKTHRCGNLKLRLADGRTECYTVVQESRDQTSRDAIDKGLIRNYGVGYSFEGYNGEKCSFNSVMSQVINLQMLKEVEEKGMNDEFFSYRQNRLNYWAVLALKARFYLWIQDKSQAAEYAGRVIANKDFRLNQGTDFAAKDNIASPEHLFSLHVYNLNDIVSNYFLNAGGVEQDQDKVKTDIFESDVTDYRVTYLWNEITEKSGTRYILEKYKQEGMPDAGLQEVPLIRLYEMYLIAIECSDLETEYKPLVDELVAARNISVVNVSTVDLKNAFVAKEYQKEFYGEGQQFFQAKRRGDKTILWTDIEGSKAVYVLPLPKSEIKFE